MTDATPATRRGRAWLTFKLSTLFLVVTIVACCFGYPHLRRYIQFRRFKAYAGQDLRKLPESEYKAFDGIVKDLLPRSESEESLVFFGAENWFVWQLPTNKGHRYLLFQGQPIFMIPGTSSASIYLFNDAGRVVAQTSFSTGWRIDIEDAELLRNKMDGDSIIRVRSQPVIGGHEVATQYYGLIDDRIVLLRLEDSGGFCLDNAYAWPNHTIGPPAESRTEEQWLHALEDARPIEVLHALIWLGGRHGDPVQNPGNFAIEGFADATSHLKVRENPKTKKILERLVNDPNSWIAEAAWLALEAR